MIKRIRDPLFYSGVWALLVYVWYVWFYFITGKLEYLLWYSLLGLAFLSLALLSRNYILISIIFCSLFFIEGVWLINFFGVLLFGYSLGNIDYDFIPGSPNFDWIGSAYHLMLAPLSLAAILTTNKVYPKAWIYSSLFALFLGLATFVLVDNGDGENINCTFNSCEELFKPLYALTNPFRIIAGSLLLSVFIFLPSNLLIEFIVKTQSRQRSVSQQSFN